MLVKKKTFYFLNMPLWSLDFEEQSFWVNRAKIFFFFLIPILKGKYVGHLLKIMQRVVFPQSLPRRQV